MERPSQGKEYADYEKCKRSTEGNESSGKDFVCI
jgi:hypothetical protein